MTASCTVTLALSLLILAVTQGCSGQLDHPEAGTFSKMQGISQELSILRDTMHDSLSLQENNSAAINHLHSLHSLPDMVSLLEDLIIQQNGNIHFMETHFSALQKAYSIIQENKEMRTQLESKEETMWHLEARLSKCHQQVNSLADSEKKLNSTFWYLQENLEAQNKGNETNFLKVENQNGTANWTQECVQQPHQQEIEELVQEFTEDKKWFRLTSRLHDVLNHSSEAYTQMNNMFMFPLSLTGVYAYKELATLLLCSGLPIDTTDSDGDTMLHGAAAYYQPQMVTFLLAHGADVNARGLDEQTPLIEAVYQGHLDMVQLLVEAGSNTTARGNNGYAALDWARYYNRTEVADYLEQFPH